MRKLKFTKAIKDNWLANLKSGKYIQITGVLEEDSYDKNHKYCCCIGVLGDCTEGLSNLSSELDDEILNPYRFLRDSHGDVVETIWKTNDRLKKDRSLEDRDYSNVISLIESLPVVED